MIEKRYQKPNIETMSREDFEQYQWKLLQQQMRWNYAHSGLCQQQFRESMEPLPHAVFKVRRWTDDRAKGLEMKA